MKNKEEQQEFLCFLVDMQEYIVSIYANLFCTVYEI